MTKGYEAPPVGSPERRRFLAWMVGTVTGVMSMALGGLSGVYLFVRPRRAGGSQWANIASLADLEIGSPTDVQYLEVVPDGWATIRRRKNAWLVRTDDDQVTAFDPRCTHLGCPYHWDDRERVFKCPCHGGVFALDGTVLDGPPPRPLDRIVHRIEDGRVLVSKLEAEGTDAS